MEIQHQDNGKNGSFFIDLDGNRVAEMTYVWAAELMIIDHTEVSSTMEGKGLGKQLVEQAVRMAREKKFRILPLCPFAKAVFDRTPAFHDVL